MSGRGSSGTEGIGGTIGARVATHLQRAVTEARVRMGPHQSAVVQRILADFTNHVSDEIRGVMGPLWTDIAGSPDVPSWLRDLTRKLGTERGQAWTWIAGSATSAALGGGLLLILQNALQPVVGPAIAAFPNIPLSPADAAAAQARGLGWGPPLRDDAAQQGINKDRFNLLTDLNRATLAAGEALELLSRGYIDEKAFLSFLARSGWLDSHAKAMLPLQRTWISPRDAASMWNRSIIDMDELREIVIRNGHHVSDAKKYAEVTGEPLPVETLMAAQRRGIIDAARARRGWVQGPVRNEWFDVAQKLQYAPMSTVDAADSVNQGHMSLADGREIAEWNGLMSEHFDTLIENAGLPPGVELATEAWNRGLITEEEFTRAFLESRLKNRYVPLYKALRWRIVPQETVRRLYRLGVYTRAQASQRLAHNGFAPADREALLAAEDLGDADTNRELTKTEIVALYVDRAIGESAARDMLADLGYADTEIGWVLAIADARRQRRYVDAVASRVRAGYVAYRLSYSEAASIMDSLGVPAEQREELVSLWDLERLATTRGLTAAQIKTALKKGLISPADAVRRLAEQGYSEDDAAILLQI